MNYVFLTPDTLGIVTVTAENEIDFTTLKTLTLSLEDYSLLASHQWTDQVIEFMKDLTQDISCTERVIYDLALNTDKNVKLLGLKESKAIRSNLRAYLKNDEFDREISQKLEKRIHKKRKS